MKTALRFLLILSACCSVFVIGSLALVGMSYAGETYIGTLTVDASTARNNYDAGFQIPSLALVSVQCTDLAYVTVGAAHTTTATSTTGVLLSSNQLLTTSVPKGNGSAGAYVAAVAGVSDGGYVNCKVFQRQGNE